MRLRMHIQVMALLAAVGITFMACSTKPQVVHSVNASVAAVHTVNAKSTVMTSADTKSQVHEVIVNDVLHAEKYTYLDVTEDGEHFWVAVPRKEVEKEETYYFVGGLKKKNFKSLDYDRVFESIYLVSDVHKDPIYTGSTSVAQALSNVGGEAEHNHDQDVQQPDEVVSLEELFTNKEKYAGKEIQVKGKCIKINKQIMGKNWVHIQDGTGGEKPYDLTVTTDDDVAVGAEVTFTGKINLNVDFGAGYKYDIIMQDARTQ